MNPVPVCAIVSVEAYAIDVAATGDSLALLRRTARGVRPDPHCVVNCGAGSTQKMSLHVSSPFLPSRLLVTPAKDDVSKIPHDALIPVLNGTEIGRAHV